MLIQYEQIDIYEYLYDNMEIDYGTKKLQPLMMLERENCSH